MLGCEHGTRANSPHPSVAKTALGYGAMIGGTVLLFLWIRTQGLELAAPPPAGETVFGVARAGHKIDNLLHVLLALVVIIVAARIVGFVFRRIGQPPVIGEIIAGILLGPSLLGPSRARSLRVPASRRGRPVSPGHRPGRRDPVHVPRRARAEPRATSGAALTSRWRSRTRASSCRSCSARRSRSVSIRSSRRATCRSPPSRSSSACRCR